MAPEAGISSDYSCIKCATIIDKTSEKVIICGEWNCFRCMHHSCSSFKPTELKFLKTYKKNIKWVCDECLNIKSLPKSLPSTSSKNINTMTVAIESLSEKLDRCLEQINRQSYEIQQHNLAINRLEQKMTSTVQTNTIQTRSVSKGKSTRDATKISNPEITNQNIKKQIETNKNQSTLSDQKTEGLSESFSEVAKKQTVRNTSPEVSENIELSTSAKNHRHHSKTLRGVRNDAPLITMENRKWVFVSQFRSDTTVEQISNYLNQNKVKFTDWVKLNIINKTVAAFKISAPENLVDSLFDVNLWPRNTIIRPYRKPFLKKAAVNLPPA